jgi:uncharacterized protein YdeI (YjbR/CyaY-like superfamily)
MIDKSRAPHPNRLLPEVRVPDRAAWRAWLAQNHDREKRGVWLIFHKGRPAGSTLEYDESVEEALCFGWVDSIVKRIDDATYCRKFTPRKLDSAWSTSNKKRVAKIIKEGRMTEHGLVKIRAARKSGSWEKDPAPNLNRPMPPEFAEALARDRKADDFFHQLPPSQRKIYVWWIASAKRPETKTARLAKALALLAAGKRL